MTKVTVLLPMYSEKIEYAIAAIESILNQTLQELSLFIILDNPQNNELKQLIMEYKEKDERIQYWINDKNLGLPASLNKLIEKVETPYIARMDADDISNLQRLEKQYMYMKEHPNVDLCGTNIIYINQSGEIIKKNKKIPQKYNTIKCCLKYKNCFSHPTFFCKTEMMRKVMYRENLRYAQDYDFVCRCVEYKYVLVNMDEYLLKYRIGNISDSKMLRQNMTAYFVKKCYRKNELIYTKSIDQDIDYEIEKYGEKNLIERVSIKQNIEKAINSFATGKIKQGFKYVGYVLTPHLYRIDAFLSEIMYKLIKQKE